MSLKTMHLVSIAVMAITVASGSPALAIDSPVAVDAARASDGGSTGGLRYVDISADHPYEALARATNGEVWRMDRDNDPEIRKAMREASSRDANFTLLFSAEGVLDTGSAELEFLTDSTTAPVSIYVSGLEERPRTELRDAGGAVATPGQKISASSSERLLFDGGARGPWKLRLEATPGENVRIVVKAGTALRFHHVWPVRPTADRKYEGPLETGNEEVFDLELNGDGLKNIVVQAVSLDGRVLESGSVRNDYPLQAARAKVRIPGQSFRLRVEGERPNGERIARMYERSFELGKLERETFYDPRRKESEETCRFLSRHGGSIFSDGNQRNPATGGIGCLREESTLTSNLSFDLPVAADGTPRTMTLRTPDYIHVTLEDCARLQEIFERHPKELVSSKRRARWRFRCSGDQDGAKGEIELTVGAIEQAHGQP